MGLAKAKKHNSIAEMLLSNTNENVDKELQMQMFAYTNMLYANMADTQEYISVFHKEKNGLTNRWGVNLTDYAKLIKLVGKEDIYFSVNTFFTPTGCVDGKVRRLNALIIDLDYYTVPHLKNLDPEEVISLMRREIDYLEPSFYVYSGQGLYLIWLLENTFATTSSKKYWRDVELILIDKFKEYGADTKVKDTARVLRPAGVINGKTGNASRIILPSIFYNLIDYSYNPQKFELSDIKEYFGNSKTKAINVKTNVKVKSKSKIKTKSNNLIKLKTINTLNYNRALDLAKIVEIRKDCTGNRENLLFLYRLNLLYAGTENNKALDLTINLNNKMANPLPLKELESATNSAYTNYLVYARLKEKYKPEYGNLTQYLSNGGAYVYSTATIIKQLEITENEQKEMVVLIGTKEKKRRKDIRNKNYYKDNKEEIKEKAREKYVKDLKEQGKLTRKEQNIIIRKKIKSLLAEGFTQNYIANNMGLGIATIKRHIKIIKEEGI